MEGTEEGAMVVEEGMAEVEDMDQSRTLTSHSRLTSTTVASPIHLAEGLTKDIVRRREREKVWLGGEGVAAFLQHTVQR